jgi:hypothetical protein
VAAGREVSGLLVGSLSRQVPPSSRAGDTRSLVAGSLSADGSPTTGGVSASGGVPAAAAGTGFGVVVLLGLGAAYEFRRTRERRST